MSPLTTTTSASTSTSASARTPTNTNHHHQSQTSIDTPPNTATCLSSSSSSVRQQQQQQQQSTTTTSTTTTTTNCRRRSAPPGDCSVAPGFGTQRDLAGLSRELGLPLLAVTSMMQARGRGMKRRSHANDTADHHDHEDHEEDDHDDTTHDNNNNNNNHDNHHDTPATPVVNAWAEFMQEEGIMAEQPEPVSTTTTTSSTTTSTTTTSTTSKSASKTKAPHSTKTTTTTTARDYLLPLVPSWQQTTTMTTTEQSNHKKKKKKQTKTTNDTHHHNHNVLVQSGTLDTALVGRSKRTMDQPYDLLVPTVLLLPHVHIDKVIAGCTAAHMLAIGTSTSTSTTHHAGIHTTVYGWGRNDALQLSHQFANNNNNNNVVVTPTRLDLPHVVGTVRNGAVGKSHTILLNDKGAMFAVGSNKVGQCGVNSSTDSVANWRKCCVGVVGKSSTSTSSSTSKECVVQVACGEQLSVALTTEGHVYTTGSSEFGQLGNGETGEHFISANKLAFANSTTFVKRTEFWQDAEYSSSNKNNTSDDKNVTVIPNDVRIGSIACGKNHTVALEAPSSSHSCPRVFTWGCGNYGCLGHGVQKDSYRPRHVQALQGPMLEHNPPISLAAGAHCSLIRTLHGHVYYFGKHRSVGEATMRPTLLDALANNGHVVTHIGAGSQTVVCSTQGAVTVAWGQGPYGELGYGPDKKSSSKPQFVAALDKCRIAGLACGQGATLYLVKKEDKDDEKAIEQLPVLKEGDTKGLE